MKYTIGTKKEMTQVFDEKGNAYPVTLIDIANVKVVGLKSKERDGYNAVVLGKDIKKHANKAEATKYKSLNEVPKKVAEFRIENTEGLEVGKALDLEVEAGQEVTVIGVSKGKGFAGVVKRHGFKGGPKTHGQSDRQRGPGSIGSGTTPGRIYKGKRMAGRMGNDRKTVKNLKVYKYDKDSNLLVVRGSIPGAKESYVLINVN